MDLKSRNLYQTLQVKLEPATQNIKHLHSRQNQNRYWDRDQMVKESKYLLHRIGSKIEIGQKKIFKKK